MSCQDWEYFPESETGRKPAPTFVRRVKPREWNDRKLTFWLVFWILAGGVFVFAGLFLYIWLFGAQSNPLDERAGQWQGNTYVNTALALQVELPEGWMVLDSEKLLADNKAWYGIGEEEHVGKVLIAAVDGQQRTGLTLSAAYGTMPGEEELSARMEERKQVSLTVFGSELCDVENLGAIEAAGHHWTGYHFDYKDIDVEEYVLVRPFKDYVVHLTVAGWKGSAPGDCLFFVNSAETG